MTPIGFELSAHACVTRSRSAMLTVRTDLTGYELDASVEVEGLIASPPCVAWSSAGSKQGRDEAVTVCEVVNEVSLADWEHKVVNNAGVQDMNALLLEPLRWWLRHQPEWCAFEQVPSVLPVWQAMAARMREAGYSTWTGVLNAADFGVGQTRQRAFLMAHKDRVMVPPDPTHGEHPAPTLFGEEVKPWVSMAEALGWLSVRELPSIDLVNGEWSLRQKFRTAVNTGQDYRELGVRASAQSFDPDWRPATTVTTKSNSWQLDSAGPMVGFPRRDDRGDPHGYRDRDLRSVHLPAFTLTGKARSWQMWERGAPYRMLHADEAAVLQSWPSGVDWQGARVQQFLQIGNAVPPLLAVRVLEAVTGLIAAPDLVGAASGSC